MRFMWRQTLDWPRQSDLLRCRTRPKSRGIRAYRSQRLTTWTKKISPVESYIFAHASEMLLFHLREFRKHVA